MSARVTFDGLAEFKAQLRRLPEHLAEQAAPIVTQAAEETGRSIQNNYPEGPTGNLKRRVRVEVRQANRDGARAIVRSMAPHAGIFEKGTQGRRTRKGWNRGRMPKAPDNQAFIPQAIRGRFRMIEKLKAMLRGEGFEVTE
jgi:hypothetical protein